MEASRRADKARDEYDAARLRLRVELRQACTQLDSAQGLAAHAARHRAAGGAAGVRRATTGFEAGKFGFLDVIDSQRTLLQARARTLNTLSTAWQAAVTIDRLLGGKERPWQSQRNNETRWP